METMKQNVLKFLVRWDLGLCRKPFCGRGKDPIYKWLPIKNSFVSIKISPTNLVFGVGNSKEVLFE